MSALRIVFFGLPLAALLLDRDGHSVELAAICRADALGLRRLRRRLGEDRVLLRPDTGSLAEHVEALRPDLLVSWFWTKKLPVRLVRAARLGGVGVHPSLLPRHRGPDPTYWAIASGDEETGVSAHRIEQEYDTGDVLGSERLAIDPRWNAWQLARALDRPSLRLLRATVARFARGEVVRGLPQDPAEVTEAPAPDDEDCAIRWSWPSSRILRHVRALAPAPGAWTEIAGVAVTVLEAAPAASHPAALEPGEAVVDGGLALVRTGDSAVVLLAGEIDGEPASAAALADLVRAGVGVGPGAGSSEAPVTAAPSTPGGAATGE